MDRNPGSAAAWFCVRSHPKHEHIAAAHLRERKLEVYLPRIRFQRCTRRGLVWFTEALFPNYFFARLDLSNALSLFHHAHGSGPSWEILHGHLPPNSTTWRGQWF